MIRFKKTNISDIDELLNIISLATKIHSNSNYWNEKICIPEYNGSSPKEWIENQAQQLAELLIAKDNIIRRYTEILEKNQL